MFAQPVGRWVHRLPHSQPVDRLARLTELAANKRVAHVGFVDDTLTPSKQARGTWLHGRLDERKHHAHVIDHREFASRAAHEEEVLHILGSARPDYIVLAGYMRLLSADFVARYSNRILNIHPSLLPAFPGVDAQWQAVAYGVKISGCTVHFVTEKLDDGPILVQRCVEVRDDDTGDTLAARILAEEHAAYVEALRKLAGNTAA